jgi:hypothetical protein
MINVRKIVRLKSNEQLPVIVLAITIVFIIHLCNKHDERTANQYMLEDEVKENHQLCSLYPSTLQGRPKCHCILSIVNFLLSVVGIGKLDMLSDLEWTDVAQLVEHVQTGRNRVGDRYIHIRQIQALRNDEHSQRLSFSVTSN